MYEMLVEKTNARSEAETKNVQIKRKYNEVTREKESLQNEITKVSNVN
jgi:septation ring formation regulator EzrA